MATLNNIRRQLTAPVQDVEYAECQQLGRHSRTRRVLLPATLLTFSLTIPVQANDEAYYHGTICQPVSASRNIVEYNLYGIYNMSTTAVAKVGCAVPMYGRDGNGTFYYATVTVYDRSKTANVSCTLRRLRETDGGI